MQLFSRAVTALCVLMLIAAYLAGRDAGAFPRPHGAVTFLDRTGLPLGTILASDSSHAASVSITDVSPSFLQAIVAAEDARYEDHGAVDLRALSRAARDAIVYGEARSGGSTIPMQLARLLHPAPSSMRGKLVQMLEAERISARSNKRDILEAYVNRIPMGGNLYGVESAARTYFGEPASDLDVAQAALLASIPNDPARLAPDTAYAALRERQRYVLDRMVALGDITAVQRDRAYAEHLHVRRHDSGISDAPHALFAVFPRVIGGPPRVTTTLDRSLQRFVQAQASDVVAALAGMHVTDAAALVVDNHTGDVLAYVGSPDYFSDEALGRNDGVQALRQPGSSLKPFTYELALEQHDIRSTTILPDVPSTFAIPGGKLYQPADYSGRFNGPVRVRFALANSLNVPAVRVLSLLGPDALLARLRDVGFEHLDKPASYYGLGLTLGGGEVSLWELVRAYVAIARNGSAIPLRLLTSDPQPASRTIGDANTWSLITNMLADAHVREKSFGYHSVLDMPFDAAVKTGTSSDFRDTWTVGYTRDYTVGVWVGNFDGSAMRGISGVTGAGPLWNRIMLHLHETNEPAPFDPPHGYVRASICATTGYAPRTSCPAVVKEWVLPSDVAVIRQRPDRTLGREYDAWLAMQPRDPSPSLRIVAPADGGVFIYNQTATQLQAQEQRLALRASGGHGRLHWTVDGAPVQNDSEGNAFWPLRAGTWKIAVRDDSGHSTATIHVIRQPRSREGFTRIPQ